MVEKEKNKGSVNEKVIGNFVGLIAVTLGIYVAIVFGVIIFSSQNIQLLVPIAWAFALLDMVVSFFMYKTAIR